MAEKRSGIKTLSQPLQNNDWAILMQNTDKPIYLDANATTTMWPKAIEAMFAVAESGPLNPSSAHGSGETARRYLTEARDNASLLFGEIDPDDLIFTSGGTEGNWLAISSFRKCISEYIISTSIEHASVFEPVTRLGNYKLIEVDENGLVNIDQLINEVKSCNQLPMVSIQLANSETGAVQPIQKIVNEIRESNIEAYVHVDAAQAIGRIKIDTNGIDFMTCSAHKVHGPHGIGLFYVSERAQDRITSSFVGAGQEKNWRSGTVNVPAAVGMGMAFKLRHENFDSHIEHMKKLISELEKNLLDQLQNIKINANGVARVQNTSNVTFFGIDGMELLARLDAQGIQASMGSACSSAKPEPSMVLRSMGLSEKDAFSTLRFSVSALNTMEEVDKAVEIICKTVKG